MSHKLYTNINIKSNEHQFVYLLEYMDGDKTIDCSISSKDNIICNGNLIRNGNGWTEYKSFDDTYDFKSLISNIRLHFPQHSVDTYLDHVNYALDVYLYIGYKKVVLGSWLVNRNESLAGIVRYQNQEYYEYVDFNIVDPWYLLYSDECGPLREIIKEEEDINNDSSILMVSLHPVQFINGQYIALEGYDGGQNSINISSSETQYLNATMKYEFGRIWFNVRYNEAYRDFESYLMDTYGWNNIKLKYLISVVGNNPDGYYCESNYSDFTIYNSNLQKLFQSNSQWVPGMTFEGRVIVTINGNDKLILSTTPLPITQELFAKVVLGDTLKIDITEIEDMNNIQIINKIEQQITNYNVQDNSKSSIIIPTFYRVRDLAQVIIHPEVTENICINLDGYKSKVDSFIMQVEGISFKEIGTTSAGTIFKVAGASLPRNNNSGTFYILNQDGELITTGKYIYEV